MISKKIKNIFIISIVFFSIFYFTGIIDFETNYLDLRILNLFITGGAIVTFFSFFPIKTLFFRKN